MSKIDGRKVFSKSEPDKNFVKCGTCGKIYGFSITLGTSTLNRHICKQSSNNDPAELNSANVEQKKIVTESLVKFCTTDCRPFGVVDGKAFLDFAQTLLDVQHKSNRRLNANSLICHSTTVSRNVHSLKVKCVEKLIKSFSEVEIDDVGIGFSTDVWTDTSSKVN